MATCIVKGTIIDGAENPVAYTTVTAFPTRAPQMSSTGNALIAPLLIKTVTSSTGYFELKLVQKKDFCINIKEIGYKEIITIPEAAEVTLWSTTPAVDPIPEPDQPPTPDNW